jgi:hypothetical protein
MRKINVNRFLEGENFHMNEIADGTGGRHSLISSSPLGVVLPNDLFLFATKIL